MIYGEKKIRNMGRSVLPSTSRRTARDKKRQTHKTHRARVRNNPELAEIYDKKLKGEMRYVVIDRRAADKLSIMRWAKAIANEMGSTPAERYGNIKKLLPNNVIGNHALSHIAFMEEYDTNPTRYGYRYRNSNKDWAEKQASYLADLVTRLNDVIESGQLKAFNTAIKQAHIKASFVETNYYLPNGNVCYRWTTGAIPEYVRHYGHKMHEREAERWMFDRLGLYQTLDNNYIIVPCDHGPRTLKGVHDIEAFISDLYGQMGRKRWNQEAATMPPALRHPEWWNAVKKFLDIEDI